VGGGGNCGIGGRCTRLEVSHAISPSVAILREKVRVGRVGAVVNAVFDLYDDLRQQPLWSKRASDSGAKNDKGLKDLAGLRESLCLSALALQKRFRPSGGEGHHQPRKER